MTVTALSPRRGSGVQPRWADLGLVEADFEEPPAEAETDWVDAAPFRAHVRQLISQSGLPWRTLAMLADVPAKSLHALVHGRSGRPVGRIHPLMARRLFYLTADSIAGSAHHQVGATEAQALLQELLAAGWTVDELSRRTGMLPGQLTALADRDQNSISRLAEATIRAAAQALLSSPTPRPEPATPPARHRTSPGLAA